MSKKLIFGRYRRIEGTVLAGYLTVSKCFDTLLERPVLITELALNKIPEIKAKAIYSVLQMKSDLGVAARLAHPAILDIYDEVLEEDKLYIVSEFTEYAPISRMSAILTSDDVFSVIEIFEKIVNTIQYINQQSIYGCCIRENNIFISPSGDLKIENFFLCRVDFLRDLPELGPHINRLAVSNGAVLLDRDANCLLDLKLTGGILKSLLYLADRERAKPVSEKPARSQTFDRAELSRTVGHKIDQIVQNLGVAGDSPSYSSVAELAEDVRSVTNEIRAAKATGQKPVIGGSVQRRRYLPGEIIFREGEISHDEAFIVEEGRVQILRTAPNGREIFLDVTQEGDILGEMAFIDGQPRMATAKAVEPCTLIVITSDTFNKEIESLRKVQRKLVDVLIRRLRYQSGEITRLKALLRVNK